VDAVCKTCYEKHIANSQNLCTMQVFVPTKNMVPLPMTLHSEPHQRIYHHDHVDQGRTVRKRYLVLREDLTAYSE